jgi:zinc protease
MKKKPFLYILLFFLFWTSQSGLALYAMPPVQKIALPNQLVLLVSEEHSLPMITIHILINSGSRQDPAGKEGLANLTSNSLLLGTLKHTITSLNEELDFMGASLDTSCSRDYVILSLRILKKDLYKGFNLLTEVLMQPAFPKNEIEKEIQRTLGAIKSAEQKPMEVAEKSFRKALFLGSPYGHPVEGTQDSLSKLTREEVIQFYETFYHPNNAIMSIVGDISIDDIKEKLIPRLTEWPASKIQKEEIATRFAKGPEVVKIDRNISQANIILGQQGISRENPDYYALTVMNYILGGGGFASRLLEEIRNNRGLAYSVTSFFDAGKLPGSFQIVMETKNPSAREAIDIALEQLNLILKKQVAEKELEGAKKYFIGSFPMRFDTQLKLAGFLVQVEYYHLGLDYFDKYPSLIDTVTSEDLLRMAKKYLHPENYILVVVANLKEAGME